MGYVPTPNRMPKRPKLPASTYTTAGRRSGKRVELQSKFEVVTELPEIGSKGTIYLIEKDGVYEEWMWIEKEPSWYANNTCYFTGGEWTKIGTITQTEEEPETPKMRPTNCKNCGAPIENGKCKYCGTEY